MVESYNTISMSNVDLDPKTLLNNDQGIYANQYIVVRDTMS